MIEPPLATLLPNAPFNAFSYLGPLGNVLRDAVDDFLVLLFRPWSLDQPSLQRGIRESKVNSWTAVRDT